MNKVLILSFLKSWRIALTYPISPLELYTHYPFGPNPNSKLTPIYANIKSKDVKSSTCTAAMSYVQH